MQNQWFLFNNKQDFYRTVALGVAFKEGLYSHVKYNIIEKEGYKLISLLSYLIPL